MDDGIVGHDTKLLVILTNVCEVIRQKFQGSQLRRKW